MDGLDRSCADQTSHPVGERVSNPNPSFFPLSSMALSLRRASERRRWRRRSGEDGARVRRRVPRRLHLSWLGGAPEGQRQAMYHGVGGLARRRASDDERRCGRSSSAGGAEPEGNHQADASRPRQGTVERQSKTGAHGGETSAAPRSLRCGGAASRKTPVSLAFSIPVNHPNSKP